MLLDTYFQPGKLPDSLADYLRGFISERTDHQAEVAMTQRESDAPTQPVAADSPLAAAAGRAAGRRRRTWCGRRGKRPQGRRVLPVGGRSVSRVTTSASSACPVGTIDSIEPRADDVKVTMTVDDDVKLPADAKALIIAPNLVSARFIQFTPAYTGGPALADGARDRARPHRRAGRVGRGQGAAHRSSARSSGRKQGGMQGPLTTFVNQAADTFDGNGDSFRKALRELSQTAGGSATRAPTCSAPCAICRCW